MRSSWYKKGQKIVGTLAFFIIYGVIIYQYGDLYGIGLGWAPAIFGGFILGMFWPFGVLLILLIVGSVLIK